MAKRGKKKGIVKSIKNQISKGLGIPLGDNVDEVLEYKMNNGNKQLTKARKGVMKDFNPKIIHEFDKLAKKKSNKLVGNPTKIKMYEDLQLKEKIVANVKKLVHPFKNSKKKKEIEVLFPKK